MADRIQAIPWRLRNDNLDTTAATRDIYLESYVEESSINA